MIRDEDRAAIAASGRSLASVEAQIAVLAGPAPRTRLLRPCTLGDGLHALDPAEAPALEALASEAAERGRVTGFVPASGAATRMVGELAAARRSGKPVSAAWHDLLEQAPRLALWPATQAAGAVAGDVESTASAWLDEGALGLQRMPKALVPFHPHPAGPRTAFEEHLRDGAALLASAQGEVRLHFTAATEHQARFEATAAVLRPALESSLGVHYVLGFSDQAAATDTVALGEDGELVRSADGRVLFRPGGHGALLGNLAATGGDVVVVRNIDNVVTDVLRPEVLAWRRRLIGLLVQTQEEAHALVHRLRVGGGVEEAQAFLQRLGHGAIEASASALLAHLDRPWRVAGMVRNEGQPGGGPFWVEGQPDPQIVEQAQVDLEDPDQRGILAASTHFNPVDLVLGLRDADGRPHDLQRYVDASAALVSEKVIEGQRARVLEHPGLWNGGMAGWNTVLVEVPGWTFQPVKTLLDLARRAHGGWLT